MLATSAYADPFLTTTPVSHDPWPLSGKPHIPSVDRVAPPGPSLGSTLAAEAAGSTVRTAGDIAFSETFEANMSAWTLSGSPTWARTDFKAGAGTWSAYCAGSSPSSPPYANNMDAWMVAGPFDLTTYTLPRLEYSMWLDSELGYDKIKILVSTDGTNFYSDLWTGLLGGWFANVPMDLTCVPTLGNLAGQSKVWIAFRFTSDYSNTATGAFIDEVRLSDSAKRPVCVWLDSVTPSVVGYNKPVTIAGALTNTWVSAGLPGKTVNVYTKTDVLSDWTSVGTLTTTGTGDYTGTLPIVRRTWFAVAFPGDTEFESGYSHRMFVAPFATSHASLMPPAMPKIARRGVLYTRWGTLKPQHTAEQNKRGHTAIFFYHYSHGKWRLKSSGYARSYRNTTSATQYSVRFCWNLSGRWRVRARHRDDDHATTYSAWRYFRMP